MLDGLTISEEVWQRARNIRLVGIDVDGVLTEGGMYYGESGEALKVFNTLDGFRIKLLRRAGIEVAVLSGRDSLMVRKRLHDLGLTHIYLGLDEKLTVWNTLQQTFQYAEEQCAFIGDDWIDVPPLMRSGLAVAVPEAPYRVRALAHYVTTRAGGKGAVAEVGELILEAQGTLEEFWQMILNAEGKAQ